MFKYDIPIDNPDEDILSRNNFSSKLADSIANWDGNESLVIGIYGEWGTGKSSVINLTKYYLQNIDSKNRPTIIEFNPWLFSDIENLTKVFFYEIAKEIELKDESKNDKDIAQKLRLLANILAFLPDTQLISKFKTKLLLLYGLIGITSAQILSTFHITREIFNNILFYIGALLIVLELVKSYLKKFIKYFEEKPEEKEKSALLIKKDIREKLFARDKKLLIIIDDIDRLTTDEIRNIFKLIKANADFPNTIYLLAFDRIVIQKNLEKQPGINGKDYLEKIVQVNFDIPHVSLQRLSKYLFKELDRVLLKLPSSHEQYFDNNHWAGIYHSGFKNFFYNLRNIKRYINSLEFNFSLLFKDNSMEVNPIDFFAIEAIRIFTPEFYLFIKNHKSLFIETTSNSYSYAVQRNDITEKRKNEIEAAISEVEEKHREDLRELIKKLFPQLSGVYGGTHYSNYSYMEWSKKLKICSPNYFDAYFTLIPGGDEDELAQYEIDNFLNSLNSITELEKLLNNFKLNKKLRSILERLQDYTDDEDKIPIGLSKNLFVALFNISDNLPKERRGMFDLGADMDIMRIIHQVLKRNKNKEDNFIILKEAIENSTGLYGPIEKVSIETSKNEDHSSYENVIPEDKLEELQKITLNKIKKASTSTELLTNDKLVYILFRWKEWDSGDDLTKFVDNIFQSDEYVIQFSERFIYETYSHSSGDNIERINKVFDKKNMDAFIPIEKLKHRLGEIKEKETTSEDVELRIQYLLIKMEEKDYRD